MAYFEKDFLNFFKELAANNNKEWFDANRKRYEKVVKDPFKAFVQELIDRMGVPIAPKDAIFRINRDIRFSKDKTPYKTNVSAIISPEGKKDKTNPGMYIELGPEDCRLYSGVYMLDKNQLEDVRYAIANDLKAFEKRINAKEFKDKFGEIQGEKAKRLPKDLQEPAEQQPLIYKKNFYFFRKFDPTIVTKDDLVDVMMDTYKAGQPVSTFLGEALGK